MKPTTWIKTDTKGQWYIIGEGQSIDEIQATGRWLKAKNPVPITR